MKQTTHDANYSDGIGYELSKDAMVRAGRPRCIIRRYVDILKTQICIL